MMMEHVSLDAFERRVREGKVSGKVDADIRMTVALIAVARAAREFLGEHNAILEEAHQPGGIQGNLSRRLRMRREEIAAALASVPR